MPPSDSPLLDFKEKVRLFLWNIYSNGGSEFKTFEFLSSGVYPESTAANPAEFEAILEYARQNAWLKWASTAVLSLGRTAYHLVQLTPLGIEEAAKAQPMMFADLPTCPLTGLPLKGQAMFAPLDGSERVLYTFAPIGAAIFGRDQLIGLAKSMANGHQKPRLDLAARCREAAERKEPALVVTQQMINDPPDGPKDFEEKRTHFLRLLYETGGSDYQERDIDTFNDFPMAFTTGAEQFYRIIKSLLADNLIQYDEGCVVHGDWVDGIQAHYHDVLPTAAAKSFLASSSKLTVAVVESILPVSLATLHPSVQQVAASRFASAHYSDAIQKACTALEKAVQAKSGQPATVTGTSLMTTAFSQKNALIQLAADPAEQFGFMNLYQGTVQALRNHFAHNLTELTDPARALEWLGFISALFYKMDEAQAAPTPPTP